MISLYERVLHRLLVESLDVPPELRRLKTSRLFHIKQWNAYFHPPETIRFSPRIPQSTTKTAGTVVQKGAMIVDTAPESLSDMEDTTTKRICFSTTLLGAVRAVLTNLKNPQRSRGSHIAVYMPAHEVEVVFPSSHPLKAMKGSSDPSKWYVHDAEKTNEVWALEPVTLAYVGFVSRKMKIPQDSSKEDEFLASLSKDISDDLKAHPNYAFFKGRSFDDDAM